MSRRGERARVRDITLIVVNESMVVAIATQAEKAGLTAPAAMKAIRKTPWGKRLMLIRVRDLVRKAYA